MIQETTHSIGEKVLLVRESSQVGETTVRIMRMSDGLYFNFISARFEPIPLGGPEEPFLAEMTPVHNSGVVSLELSTLPQMAGRLLVEYFIDGTGPEEYQMLLFGSRGATVEPDTCRVYGRVRDVSGKPVPGQRVDVLMSNGGYFPHKSGLIATSQYALTDDSGYFELKLVHGLDVVIAIPSIGFTQKGIVPPINSVEITGLMPRK